MKVDKKVMDLLWRMYLEFMSSSVFGAMIPGNQIVELLAGIKKSQTDFDVQVTDAVASLQKTSALIAALEDGVKDRMQKLQKVREEHERYSGLAQIEGEKAKALLAQLEMTLGKGAVKERWIALLMHVVVGFIFFAAGVAVGHPLEIWVGNIWSKLKI